MRGNGGRKNNLLLLLLFLGIEIAKINGKYYRYKGKRIMG